MTRRPRAALDADTSGRHSSVFVSCLSLSVCPIRAFTSVICLPFKTPSYSEGAVAGEEQGIAKCTLRNFPSLDIHW